jgi:peptide/nickel transport system permease protein
MQRFLIRRILVSILTLLAISVLIFGLSRGVGDPRSLLLSEYATPEQWNELGVKLGLDKPYTTQYWIWLKDAAVFDFGRTVDNSDTVRGRILDRMPATIQLGMAAFLFSMVVGVPLGILSSVKRGSIWDNVGKGVALMGQSMPPFWLGIMLIFFFAVRLDLVPPSGRHDWNSFILPTVTLGMFPIAANLRIVRTAMLEVLDSEYIKLARAKGVSSFSIIWVHALRNALIPPLTYVALTLGFLITGSVVAETVFQWPGLGMLAFDSLQKADYPTLQGVVMVIGVWFIGINLLTDILYAYVDPRIRFN